MNNEHYESLMSNNITHGLATVVCVGFSKWALPGGRVVKTKRDALRAASKMHKLMGGE